jgi:hypothetical protein
MRATSCLVRLARRRRLLRFLLDEHSQSLIRAAFKTEVCYFVKLHIDHGSFYEGHTMDLVTFATRVCKLLGIETMIGMSCQPHAISTCQSLDLTFPTSHKCGWWLEWELRGWRHRMLERRMFNLVDRSWTHS